MVRAHAGRCASDGAQQTPRRMRREGRCASTTPKDTDFALAQFVHLERAFETWLPFSSHALTIGMEKGSGNVHGRSRLISVGMRVRTCARRKAQRVRKTHSTQHAQKKKKTDAHEMEANTRRKSDAQKQGPTDGTFSTVIKMDVLQYRLTPVFRFPSLRLRCFVRETENSVVRLFQMV